MHPILDILRALDAASVRYFVAVPIADLLADADHKLIGETAVPVASRSHLIALKRAAGRPQDLADIAALQELDGDGG